MAEKELALTKPVAREALTKIKLSPIHVGYRTLPGGKDGMLTVQPGDLPDGFHAWLLGECLKKFEYVPPPLPEPEPDPVPE